MAQNGAVFIDFLHKFEFNQFKYALKCLEVPLKFWIDVNYELHFIHDGAINSIEYLVGSLIYKIIAGTLAIDLKFRLSNLTMLCVLDLIKSKAIGISATL